MSPESSSPSEPTDRDPGRGGSPDWSALAPDWDAGSRTAEGDAAAERELDRMTQTAERVNAGGLRAAVLGVNDGLVTNLCMVLGVVGASVSAETVRLSGLASLIAGALSMAAGEWVSMRTQVESAEGLERSLRRAWRMSPPVVLTQMSRKLQERGVESQIAERASEDVAEGVRKGEGTGGRTGSLDTSTEILAGIRASDSGSPMVSAVSSLLLFAVGALVPLLPWFFASDSAAVWWSVVLTGAASLLVGGALGRGSNGGMWWSALRQLLIVAVASAITYGIGAVAGTAVT
jgi:VIT1/CCC1 family predicted Fe2+/Mn2+ transporter